MSSVLKLNEHILNRLALELDYNNNIVLHIYIVNGITFLTFKAKVPHASPTGFGYLFNIVNAQKLFNYHETFTFLLLKLSICKTSTV